MTVVVIVFIVIAALLAAATLGFTSADMILEAQEKKAAQRASERATPPAAPEAPIAASTPVAQAPTVTAAAPVAFDTAAVSKTPAPSPLPSPKEAQDEVTALPIPLEAENAAPEDPLPCTEVPVPTELPMLDSTDVETADALLSDSEATAWLRTERGAGKGPLAAVNLDAVNAAFDAGETVTLKALRQKGLVPQRAGRVKILARGTLDKPLTIKAEAFSAAALKMICVTGGSAILLKR